MHLEPELELEPEPEPEVPAPPPPVKEEPEKIKKWREEQKARLEEKGFYFYQLSIFIKFP